MPFEWNDGYEFSVAQNRHINDCPEFHSWLASQEWLEKLYLTPDLTEGMRQAELCSFIGFDHIIADTPVRPLSLAGVALLSACGCAYIDGGKIGDTDSDLLAYVLVHDVDGKLKPSNLEICKDYRHVFGSRHIELFLDYVMACYDPLSCITSEGSGNTQNGRKLDGIWLAGVISKVNEVCGLNKHETLKLSMLEVCHLLVEWKRKVDKKEYPRPSKAGEAIGHIRRRMWEICERDGVV